MPFDFGERLGLFLIVEAALLSTIAVTTLLLFVGYRLYKKYQSRRLDKKRKLAAIQQDASSSYYFISLMVGELIQALGGVLNIQWIIDATVTGGSLCTAQGVLKQVGDVAVALTSLAIALQTFTVLVLRWREPKWTSSVVIAAIWIFVALAVGVGSATHPSDYYSDTGYWCWINEKYETERITLEYLWLWIALVMLVVIYGTIALVMRGVLVFDHGIQFRLHRRQARVALDISPSDDEDDRTSKAVANLMMFYPLVYAICVFPVSLVRWMSFNDGVYVPPGATIFASILFSLSGLLNAILYKETRLEIKASDTPQMPDIPLGMATPPSPRSGRGRMPDFGDEDEVEEHHPYAQQLSGSYVSLHRKDYEAV